MDNFKIEKTGNRIIMTKNDQSAGYIDTYSDGKTIDFIKVYIDPSFRGQSLAGIITKWGFEWAKENGQKVIPTCPYIGKAFLPRNPEYRELVAD